MHRTTTDRAIRLLALWTILIAVATAQVPPKVEFLAQFNGYSTAGYNDCWGYTAPDGREYALLGVTSGTSVIDITDAPTLREVGFIPNHRGLSSLWKDIKTYRQYAYVVTESPLGGLQIIDLSQLPASVSLLRIDTTVFRASHNIYIDTTRALLYLEGNSSNPVFVWSLANPAQPVVVSTFGPVAQQVHDVYARGNRAYLSEGTTATYSVFDVTNPAAPSLLKRWTSPSGGYAHNAWLSDDGNFLMTTEETVGRTVKLWDISNLDSVRLRGAYLGPNQLAHNTHLKGRYAYISHYKDGLRVVDLQDPDALMLAGSYDTYAGGLSGDFHGAWGAYPFFRSGKILISDMERGLFVVFYAPSVVTSAGDPPERPLTFTLEQNYPNPFNPETNIRFLLPERMPVRLFVSDILGREVGVLADGNYPAGPHTVRWMPDGLATGVYIATLHTPRGSVSRRMLLAR